MAKHYLYTPVDVPQPSVKNDTFVSGQIQHYLVKYGSLADQRAYWQSMIDQVNSTLPSDWTDPLPDWMQRKKTYAENGLRNLNTPHTLNLLAKQKANNKHNEINPNVLRGSNIMLDWDRSQGHLIWGTFDAKCWRMKSGTETGTLSMINNDDTLLINGHGSNSGNMLGFHRYPTNDTDEVYVISPQTLAHMLKVDGLSNRHDVIKLNMCIGSGRQNSNGELTFAKVLATELGRHGYPNVRVGGYEVTVERNSRDILKGNRAGAYEGTDHGTALKGTRVWYDSRGTRLGQGSIKGTLT
ncbi:MAG: hypothetical protein MK132_21985 [Lentisphaerales bacterium]|nr:hypothetical protein [Lentisphaerales bacterium]